MMKTIDFRSDTVTQPTEEMRAAMANAVVGDDVFADDPTINLLEKRTAEILGKQSAIFTPTGTFANQLAVFTHCERGSEIITGESNHVFINEVGGLAVIAGVQARTLQVEKGYMDPVLTESKIRVNDLNYPVTSLICIENAHSSGHVMTMENMRDIYDIGQKHNIPVHCDGARIFNAASYLNVDVKELSQHCDTISVCLSKGLCAPVGTMLAGDEEFIRKTRKKRKVMGGGMRQVGVLGAAGLIAIEKMTQRLHLDHENAKILAAGINEIDGLSSNIADVQINMVFVKFSSEKMTAMKFVQALKEKGILTFAAADSIRFVTHNGITKNDVDYLINTSKEILA